MDRAARKSKPIRIAILVVSVAALLATDTTATDKKKDKPSATANTSKLSILDVLDYSKIVWPNPPAITRVAYLSYFSGEKYVPKQQAKSNWMDRLSGVTTGETHDTKQRFQLLAPYGIATDSKGMVYIADSKVGAVFIVNPETKEFSLIGNGRQAKFQTITGLAIDDADRLFVSDSGMRRVLVLDPQHKVEGSIVEGIGIPGGLAVDNENRFLYVCDAGFDQVLVYDADPPHRLIRRIGTGGKQHTLTAPGDFARPTNVAVDDDGNVYVSDTMNFRIEVFDADGNFIRTWGKAGDSPGYFARPKGITVDSDGDVWVADEVQDRLQLFTPEGRLLMWMGGHGGLPGQFNAIVGVAFDRKRNRIYTTEQYPGRMQMFLYFTNDQAMAEMKRRDEDAARKSANRSDGPQEANAAAMSAAPSESRGEAQPASGNEPPKPANPFAAARAKDQKANASATPKR